MFNKPTSGANVIKLFARVFVRQDWKSLLMTNTSLLRKSVIYGQKSFLTLGPEVNFLNIQVRLK
jgi:hypothetical protein